VSTDVTFVENYNNVLPILKKNILNLDYQEKSTIIESNIIDNFNFKTFQKKFDLIFLDPPYKEKKLLHILDSIIESAILNNGGIIIIHRHKKDEGKFPDNFRIIEEKTYGVSRVIFGNYS